MPFGTKSSGLIIKGGLKIEGCKIEGLLYIWITKANTGSVSLLLLLGFRCFASLSVPFALPHNGIKASNVEETDEATQAHGENLEKEKYYHADNICDRDQPLTCGKI